MRISTNQLFDRSIQSVLDNQSDLSDVQQQLATGKKLLRPSDDPVGAAQVVRIAEELDKLTQFQRNNSLLTNALEQEEAVLRNVTQSVQRARQLAIQSGNGILSQQDRAAIGVEISQIRDEVFDLMNSRDSNGEFIFAGFQADSPAFVFNATAPGNKYTFQGDDGRNQIRVSDTVLVEQGDSGKEVFENVLARLKADITGGSGTNASLDIAQQATFDQFHLSNYDPVTAANNVYRGTVNGAGTQIDFINAGTGAAAGSVNFTSGQPFTFNGLELNITGGAGDTLEFTLAQPEKKNIAETLNDLFVALDNATISGSAYEEAIDDAIVGIDNALEAVANTTAAVGGRINVAQSALATNLDLEIAAKSARSTIEDVDYAEAASELSRQETALQAAQATFPRVTGLSLFDFI